MTVYAVLPTYDRQDNVYYQVLPYNLKGTVKCHFKHCRGLKSLIPFLFKCRLTESKAQKLADRLMK